MAEFTSSFYSTKLHANVKGVAPRGGASMIEVSVVVFVVNTDKALFRSMII